MPDKPTILVVGELERCEFSLVRDWLRHIQNEAEIQKTPGLAPCLSDNHRSNDAALAVPDIVVVCQSWPDEFPACEVTTALGRWPLTLWACCYGAWCDSDGRTRSIWPISVRVPASEAPTRLDHLWRILAKQEGEPLPLTASRDEAFEFDHCDDRVRPGNVEGDHPMTRLNVVEKTNGF